MFERSKPSESDFIKLPEMIIKDEICQGQDDMGNGMMPGIRDVASTAAGSPAQQYGGSLHSEADG